MRTMDINQLTICGRLTRDAELRSNGQKSVLRFSIASSMGFGEKKHTSFFNCALFGSRAEKLEKYMAKGKQVIIAGSLKQGEYNGKKYVEILVNEVQLLASEQKQEAKKEEPEWDAPF